MPACEHNFAHRLVRHAAERGSQRALVRPAGIDSRDGRRCWTQISFAELDALSDAYAHGLSREGGVRPGDRVILLIKPSFEFFAVGFALYKLGAVSVLIDPGMGLSGFLACVEQIAPRVAIGVPMGMALSRIKGRAFRSVEQRVTVGGSTWFWGGTTLARCQDDRAGAFAPLAVDPDTEASILFTSGSTGPAKGVRYTHGMFGTQAERIGGMYGIQPGEVDVPCFLPFAMFSVALGMTVVLPDIDFSKPATAAPEAVIEAVKAHGAQQLVGSPAVMQRLGDRGEALPGLKRVLTFGAPIPVPLHAAFRELLDPGVEVHTPYGATESLPVATIASSAILAETAEATARGLGTCVGHTAPHTEVRIIGITEQPIAAWSDELALPVGEIGEICVKGPQVSREYKGLPEATRDSKIADGDAVWHRMGDLGYLDAQGRLWFCGRKAHRVTCKDGAVLFPVRLEGVFNQHPQVRRSAVVGVEGEPVLVVELRAGAEASRVKQELLQRGAEHPETARVKRILVHGGFPVDRRHNAKIERLELAAWAASQGS